MACHNDSIGFPGTRRISLINTGSVTRIWLNQYFLSLHQTLLVCRRIRDCLCRNRGQIKTGMKWWDWTWTLRWGISSIKHYCRKEETRQESRDGKKVFRCGQSNLQLGFLIPKERSAWRTLGKANQGLWNRTRCAPKKYGKCEAVGNPRYRSKPSFKGVPGVKRALIKGRRNTYRQAWGFAIESALEVTPSAEGKL